MNEDIKHLTVVNLCQWVSHISQEINCGLSWENENVNIDDDD